MSEELELQPRHRELSAIALDLAKADADLTKIKAKAKQVADGYKAQVEGADEILTRYRNEYTKASYAAGTITMTIESGDE